MEFCIQAWSPYLQKDIKCLEKIKRRATKMVYGLKDTAYDDRLKILGLLSLENRRLQGDLIELFKLLTDRENVNKEQFFKLSEFSHLRGRSLKLSKPRSTRQVRQNFFSQRVVDIWNKLPSNIISSTCLRTDWTTIGMMLALKAAEASSAYLHSSTSTTRQISLRLRNRVRVRNSIPFFKYFSHIRVRVSLLKFLIILIIQMKFCDLKFGELKRNHTKRYINISIYRVITIYSISQM